MITTFKYDQEANSMECRLLGENYVVTRAIMITVFGFNSQKGAGTDTPKDFNAAEAWHEFTGYHNWNSNGSPCGFIKDGALDLLHKFIAYNVLGKVQANKVTEKELFLLWAAKHEKKVCISSFIWAKIKGIQKNDKTRPSFSHIAAGIAGHFQLHVPAPPTMECVESVQIHYTCLKNVGLLLSKTAFVPFEQRECVDRYLARQARAGRTGDAIPSREITMEEGDIDSDEEREGETESAIPNADPNIDFQTRMLASMDAQTTLLTSLVTEVSSIKTRLTALEDVLSRSAGVRPPSSSTTPRTDLTDPTS